MKTPTISWKLVRRIAGMVATALLCLIMFVSDRFLYLSHERFPRLAYLQLNRRTTLGTHDSRPEIIGHRGSGLESLDWKQNGLLIGNTRAAIKAALEHADWIEIDVRKTADSPPNLVCFHDAELDKKTDGSGVVSEKELDDLKKLTTQVPHFEGGPERILTLEEVLAEFDSTDRQWIIDIKSEGISDQVLELLSRYDLTPDRVILFGDHEVLQQYRNTKFPRGYTALAATHPNMLYSHSSVLQRCSDESYDYLVVPTVFVTLELGADCAARNISLWSYDSNDVRDLEYVVNCGVRGLIVDKPQDIKHHFGRSAASTPP
ncbi:MAG: glycerophosphodiester phosphodiesterase [Aureliella sp.]